MHFIETDACLPQTGNSHVTYNHLSLCIVIHAHFIVFVILVFVYPNIRVINSSEVKPEIKIFSMMVRPPVIPAVSVSGDICSQSVTIRRTD